MACSAGVTVIFRNETVPFWRNTTNITQTSHTHTVIDDDGHDDWYLCELTCSGVVRVVR